jgi:hypothetical protein
MRNFTKKQITLNFRRLSEKSVGDLGAATLGIEEKETPVKQELDPREFMNAEELKAIQQCEDSMRQMQDRVLRLNKELEREKGGFFGTLKNAITGRKTGIMLELDRIAKETVEARAWMADVVAHSRMRGLKEKEAAEAIAKMTARRPAPSFQSSGAFSAPAPE